MFDIIIRHQTAFTNGLIVTLELSLLIWSIGIILGSVLGYFSSQNTVLQRVNKVSTFFLSGVPILVLLFWAHFPLQAIFQVVIDPFITSVFVLSLVNVFAVSTIVNQSIADFPEQYITAARVCGISERRIVQKIKLPIILRQIIPPLLMSQVNMLQMTLFASLISVNEIFRVAQRVNAVEYKPVEIYTALALFFLIICLPLNGLAQWLKYRYTRNISEK